jgi:tetratricopeptide (TPR) repeat protein
MKTTFHRGANAASAFARRLLAAVLLSAALTGGDLLAKEPVEEFLSALTSAGMYEVAEEYLETLPGNPNVAPEIKETVPFQLANIIVARSDTIGDMNARLKELDRARAKYEEFVQKAPSNPLAQEAESKLGTVLIKRGSALVALSTKPANAGRKDELIKDARGIFDQAQAVFDKVEKQTDAEYEQLKAELVNKMSDEDKAKRRDKLNDVLLARLNAATARYESAKAYDPGTPENLDRLKGAADKYHALYEKFRARAAGLYAGMFEGRCYQDMGDTKRALAIYSDLQLQPDEPAVFREIKSKALALAVQAWTTENEKQYEVAAAKGQEWIDKIRGDEDRTQEGYSIRYFTAVAQDKVIETMQAQNANPNEIKKKVGELVANATFLSNSANEYKQLAKTLVAKYRKVKDAGEPQTFADARDAAKAALDAMTVAQNKIKVAEQTKNAEMLAQLPAYQKEVAEGRDAALKYYQLALDLREEETSADEINAIRYYLCFLMYQQNRFYDAAVMGEFLARSYPKAGGAKPAAKIAMASYLQGYNNSKPEDRGFEVRGMVSIADYITKAWPGEPEADEAWMMLADLAIREQDLTKAAEYLAKIPQDSSRRGEADLKAGQALWGAYLKAARLPEGERPSQEELDKMVKQAQATLESGVARLRANLVDPLQATYTLLASELSLAQIYIGSGQADKAVKILEQADSGALALVRSGSPVVQVGNFPDETYKAALRAYVGTQQLDNAEKVMGELEAAVSNKPDASATLTKIYISLGLELEEQVNRLKNEKKLEELQKVLAGFDTFLTKISQRQQGNTFSSLNWVAQTFFRLASGLDAGDKLSPEAKGYYEKAAQTYQAMLDRGKSDPAFFPNPQATIGLQISIASCQRALGQYKEALDVLGGILATNPKILEGQVEAAKTYQKWGEETPSYYNQAMLGGREDKQTKTKVIWGWNKLGQMVMRNPKYSALFFDSRYNLADCNFRLAMTQPEAEKAKSLKQAEQVIAVTYKLNPKLGGDEMYRKFDRLLKAIQSAQGVSKAAGLKGLDQPKQVTTTAAGAAANP